jgi:hypothetical protein
MTGFVLIVAEPDGQSVAGSLHKTAQRTMPPAYSAAGVSITPIKSLTTASADSWQYTFVCGGCLGQFSNFNQASTEGSIAWAFVSSSQNKH